MGGGKWEVVGGRRASSGQFRPPPSHPSPPTPLTPLQAAFESGNTAFVLGREFVKLSAALHDKPVSKAIKSSTKISFEDWSADVLSAGEWSECVS